MSVNPLEKPASFSRKTILQFALIYLGFFTFAGLFLILWGAYMFKDYLDSSQWETANGVITDNESFALPTKGGYNYFISIRYDYTVNGNVYQNIRLASDEGFCLLRKCKVTQTLDSQRDVDEYQAAYPLGEHVKVLYDPNNPQRSFLERRFPLWGLLLVFFGIPVFIFAGGFFLDRAMKYDKLQQEEATL